MDRQICDALKAGIGGEACRIVKSVDFPAACGIDGETVGLEDSTPLGSEAQRQFLLECWPRSKESGINHMTSPLSVVASEGCGDLRSKIYEVEGRIREVDAFKGAAASDDVREVVFMKIFCEELGLHARRQALHQKGGSYEDLRGLLVKQAGVKDEGRVATGALKSSEGEPMLHGEEGG